ncbi:MAG: hypothetical protein BGO69_18005 [Bacteroidetes bacterium 46-16]|nr:MAG: hypothetical protein BGO69_18005 [Bacteroidetes bacterium 46-16]
MINRLLLPRSCKLWGLVLLPFAFALLIAVYNYSFSIPFLKYNMGQSGDVFSGKQDFIFNGGFSTDFSGELSLLLTFGSLFMIAFSAEKNEDEYVSSVRLRALQLSVYANYIILAITSVFIYGLSFLMVMELNLFTILIIFILIFNFDIHIKPRLTRSAQA